MEDFILKEMEEAGADGVDFVPIFTSLERLLLGESKIICSYSKEEWLASSGAYPKSGRLYWKIIDGKKIYV